MKSLILFLVLSLTSTELKQASEDSKTRVCYYGYISGHFGAQIKNKQCIAMTYTIVWPDGYIGSSYPSIPAGGSYIAYHTAPFIVGTLSATPANGGTVAVYVGSQLGHTRCN